VGDTAAPVQARVEGRGRMRRQAIQYDWTIMVYLSGDNNLSSEMLWAITEIERVSATTSPRVAVTVQYDPLSPGVGTLRYAIAKQSAWPVSQRVKDLPITVPFRSACRDVLPAEDAASPAALRDFIDWSTKHYRSTRRMLILSGHGSGSDGDFLTDNNPGASSGGGPKPAAAAAMDAAPRPGSLTIPALRLALDAPKAPTARPGATTRSPRIDVLGMDSCLMSTMEVAYEIRNSVRFLVASEGFVPNTGWPYAELLTALSDRVEAPDADADAAAMSTAIVDTCAQYYALYLPAGISFDIAACNLAHMKPLKRAISTLADRLAAGIGQRALQNAVLLAHWRAQSFKFEQYADLWDFCDQLREEVQAIERAGPIAAACDDVVQAIEAAFAEPPTAVASARSRQQCVGIEFQHAHGLSVYFPWSAPAGAAIDAFDQYGKMSFAKATHWATFLKAYLAATKRAPRRRRGLAARLFPTRGTTGAAASTRTKNVAEYNKNVAEYNKFLNQVFGGTLPWCMKNPPQQVDLSTQPAPAVKP
jgi:hypothetical protein